MRALRGLSRSFRAEDRGRMEDEAWGRYDCIYGRCGKTLRYWLGTIQLCLACFFGHFHVP